MLFGTDLLMHRIRAFAFDLLMPLMHRAVLLTAPFVIMYFLALNFVRLGSVALLCKTVLLSFLLAADVSR